MNMALWLVLWGCGGDTDSDGFDSPLDCDDSDAAVHPGAAERCDAVDQDCDGQIDEDPEDGVTGFLDLDGDGHGSGWLPVQACELEGLVASSDDCADTDPTRHPDALETCDGLDQDCDGEVDESPQDPTTWYADADGDGFGDPDAATTGCERPEGYVSDATDCDDAEPSAWPGSPELAGDGVDNDCNGAVDDGPVANLVDISSVANLVLSSAQSGVALGSAIGAGDLSGDGVPDLILGAPGVSPENPSAGRVLIYASPLTGAAAPGGVTASLSGTTTADRFGAAVTLLTDQDGDGLDELVLGAPGLNEGRGAVHVVGDWLTGAHAVDSVGFSLSGPNPSSDFGDRIADAGDLDGDGWHELVIGAPIDESYRDDAGRTYLLYGPITGPLDVEDGVVLQGEAKRDIYGAELVGVGDTDGDGLDDFVVGAREAKLFGKQTGVAYVYTDAITESRFSIDAQAAIGGGNGKDGVSTAMASAGDIDGDGLQDLIVGAPTEDWLSGTAGAAYVLLAPFSGEIDVSDSRVILLGTTAGDLAGAAVSGGEDLTGDGVPDVVVGAPAAAVEGGATGVVYLADGAMEGVHELAYSDQTLVGGQDDAEFGAVVLLTQLGAGPLGDLVLAAPGSDEDAGADAGRTWLVLQ